MNKRAQSTLEITVLIAIVVAAFLAMQGYFKTSLQRNWKNNIDSFSDEQYEEGKTTGDVDSIPITIGSSSLKTNLSGDTDFSSGGNITDWWPAPINEDQPCGFWERIFGDCP